MLYREASSPDWTKLQSYYKNSDDAGDNDIVLNGNEIEITYDWDIVGLNIEDGNYEFKVESYCGATNDPVITESNIIQGIINRTAPQVFGTPQPSDGILDVGEDILVRFNQNIFEGDLSLISLRAVPNKQPIQHDVYAVLDGVIDSNIRLPRVAIPNEDLTIQFWMDYSSGDGSILEQEGVFKVEIENKKLRFTLRDQMIETTDVINTDTFNFYSFVYQGPQGNTNSIIINF